MAAVLLLGVATQLSAQVGSIVGADPAGPVAAPLAQTAQAAQAAQAGQAAQGTQAIPAQTPLATDTPAGASAGLAATGGGLVSRPGEPPAWVAYEQARLAFAQGEYGKALQLASIALDRRGIYPEAEVLIADVYALQEPELAERAYQRALERRRAFEVQDFAFAVQYRLATLYENQGPPKYRALETTLLELAAIEAEFSEERFARMRQAMEDTYRDDGLDRALVLYRLDTPVSVRAHRTLGWLYYRSGRFNQAVRHSLFAVVNIVSEVARELRRRDPEYELAALNRLLAQAHAPIPRSNRVLANYLADAGLYEALYYLAAGSFARGDESRARELWRLLLPWEAAGEFRQLAREQLRDPWIEPLIELGPPDRALPSL